MAALSQGRALGGCRAFSSSTRGSRKALSASNGTKWYMRKKDSYMVEVRVGEEESEDVAVRRYMKAVMSSGVINELRARRRVETKIEYNKRKLFERAQARKLGFAAPTFEQLYGVNEGEPKPFDEFFSKDEFQMDIFSQMSPEGGAAGFMVDYDKDEMFDVLPQYAASEGYSGGFAPGQQGFGQNYGAGWPQQAAYPAQGYIQQGQGYDQNAAYAQGYDQNVQQQQQYYTVDPNAAPYYAADPNAEQYYADPNAQQQQLQYDPNGQQSYAADPAFEQQAPPAGP